MTEKLYNIMQSFHNKKKYPKDKTQVIKEMIKPMPTTLCDW